MGTWVVKEDIGHLARNGSEVYTCSVELKKAFDVVSHSLFRKRGQKNATDFHKTSTYVPDIQGKMEQLFIRCFQYSEWQIRLRDGLLLRKITKVWINNVYSTSFYGTPLWDMFDHEFKKHEK